VLTGETAALNGKQLYEGRAGFAMMRAFLSLKNSNGSDAWLTLNL
jgi:hypothetical protein